MKTMKFKKIFRYILILTAIVIIFNFLWYGYISKKINHNHMNERLNLKIPFTNKVTQVIYDDKAFFGEGDFCTIYDYSDKRFQLVKDLDIGDLVNEKNVESINKELYYFRSLTKNISFKDDNKVDLAMAEIGDRFLKYVNESDDKSYEIILIKYDINRIEILKHNN